MNRKALISLETKKNPSLALGEASKFLKIDGTLYWMHKLKPFDYNFEIIIVVSYRAYGMQCLGIIQSKGIRRNCC